MAQLADRSRHRETDAARESVVVYRTKVLPASAAAAITSAIGPFPTRTGFPNDKEDAWTTRALTDVLWKNGVPTYLTDGLSSDAMANDIFIDGTDIYACGRRSSGGSGEYAQLWKNGVATVLSASGSNGIAQSVYVKNGDVYVSELGFLSGPVRLWKNNIPTLLTTGANFNAVSSVIVK